MPLQSAEQIVCKVFGKTTSSHVQLHRHIIPACRYLKVHGIRGKSKVHSLREISNLVEFRGPRYSMVLSKSYNETRGVMPRGVCEGVIPPTPLS